MQYMSNYINALDDVYKLHHPNLSLEQLLSPFDNYVFQDGDDPPDIMSHEYIIYKSEPVYRYGVALGKIYNLIFGKPLNIIVCDDYDTCDQCDVLQLECKRNPLFTFYCEFTTMFDQFGYTNEQRHEGFKQVIDMIK